jgi:O-antigen/teichoic acid export membrane protein
MLAALWLTPFLLHHIGQHSYGLWLVGLQILSYLMLMDFGIVALLPRETAWATGREIRGTPGGDLPHVIGRSTLVVLYQTPLVAAAVAIFWLVLPGAWREVEGPVMVVLVGFTVLFPLRVFQAVLQGLQDLAFFSRVQMVSWAVSTVLTVVMVLRGFNLYALAWGWVAMQALATVIAFLRLRSHFPGVLPSRLPALSLREVLGSLTSGFWVSVSQLAQVLVGSTDYLIIGRILGPSAVVPYSCTQKLVAALRNQPYMVMEAAAPGLSQMKTSESPERIFQASSALTLGMLTLAGAVSCVTLAVNKSFVYLWLGSSQFGGNWLSISLILAAILRHWNTTTVYSIFALGYERRISITTLIDGAFTLVSGFFLVKWLGLIGAPIGSILAVCLISVPGNLWALAREVKVPVSRILLSIWPWFWRFWILAIGAGILGLRTHDNLPYVAGVTFLTGLVYGAVMLPMLMNSCLRSYLPPMITQSWDRLWRRVPIAVALSEE